MSLKIRKNIHIDILKYAQKYKEFTLQQIMHDLRFNQNEKDLFSKELINSKLLLENTGREEKTGIGRENIYTISVEGRFKLLDHQQLWWAKVLSVIAIVFSFFVTIYVSCIQTNKPVMIDPDQFDKIYEMMNEFRRFL